VISARLGVLTAMVSLQNMATSIVPGICEQSRSRNEAVSVRE
jgi:hypothetical protein